MTRSSRLLSIGVLVIVVGLVVAFLALRDDSDPIAVNEPNVEASGTAGNDDGIPVEGATERGIGQLAEDASRMPSPLVIPEGLEAIAVSAAYANGVAAIPAPGDLVNVYAIYTDGVPPELQELQDELKEAAADAGATPDDAAGPATPASQQDDNGVIRLLQSVEVLGVSGVLAESGGGAITLVLAVNPDDAERLIYQVATQQIWFTLVNPDDEPQDGVGVVHDNILSEALS